MVQHNGILYTTRDSYNGTPVTLKRTKGVWTPINGQFIALPYSKKNTTTFNVLVADTDAKPPKYYEQMMRHKEIYGEQPPVKILAFLTTAY